MAAKKVEESRAGVALSNLDAPLFDGAGATKRDLIDYLDAVADRMIGNPTGLADRPLSVLRVRPGQEPFMQKNLPKYTPEWVRRTELWSAASRREVSYALCDDRATLLWFANQRAVEYHVPLYRMSAMEDAALLVLDLDPPDGSEEFAAAVGAAMLVRAALAGAGLDGALKTSGAKGVHVIVPVTPTPPEDAAAATRAIAARAAALDPALATTAYIKADRGGRVFVDSTRAHGATVIAAYSPRLRPGVPVSFPLDWADADAAVPADFTIRNAAEVLGDRDPWSAALPAPAPLPADLVAEGHEIPVARVAAMHEGKRRKRASERAIQRSVDGGRPELAEGGSRTLNQGEPDKAAGACTE